MRGLTPLFLLFMGVIVVTFAGKTQAEVYRCTTNGSVTYSDTPCKGQARTPTETVPLSNAVTTPSKPAAANFYGTWTGQAQYQATARGQSLEAAHAVVSLVLNVAPDGKLTGESKDNGCRALGLASPSFGQTLKLDVSLTGCKYVGYNRRYTGTFAVPLGKDYATASIAAYDTRPGTPSVMYDITATMRR